MSLADLAHWIALAALLPLLLWLDLRLFARGREPRFKEAALWSVGWLALSLVAAFAVLALDGGEAAVEYTTVYLIERSLSLDNLVVFLMLFAYFGVPHELRGKALFWGIVAALVLRGGAILGGVALLEQFHWVIYPMALLLLALAWRIFHGVDENVDPETNLLVRAVRRVYPVSGGFSGNRWFVTQRGRRHATPLFLCLAALVFADIAFAIDSIPAAFAITRNSFVIWMGNVFALLGLRALFVLVEGLVKRFRYLDETIAVVLAFVGVKLILEEWVHIGPLQSLAVVAGLFGAGIAISVLADRRKAAAGSAAGMMLMLPPELMQSLPAAI